MALELDVPLEVMTRGLTTKEAHLAKRLVRQYAAKLATITPDIIMCRVAVEKPQKFQNSGNPYRVRVRVTAPGHVEVVVVKDTGQHGMHDPMQMVVKDAFHAAMRTLDGELSRRRTRSREHEGNPNYDDDAQPSVGFVVRMHRDQDYGFLKAVDGRELYFHRNSVLHGGFDDLRPGAQVRFEAEQGDEGPQATTVQILAQHGGRNVAGNVEDPQGWVREDD